MAGLKAELFQEVAEEAQPKGNNKVTVVGIGAVGMAAAFSILAQVCVGIVKIASVMAKYKIYYRMFHQKSP